MRLSRPRVAGVLAGVASTVMATVLFVPATAQAATAAGVGHNPGQLSVTPAYGKMTSQPTWTTKTACGGAFTTSAKLEAVQDDGSLVAISATVRPADAPLSGTLLAPLDAIAAFANLQPNHSYELVVVCQDANRVTDPQQSAYLNIVHTPRQGDFYAITPCPLFRSNA